MKLSLNVTAVLRGMTATLVLCLAALPAFPQESSPCARDLEKYCKDVKPGEGRVLKCYEENKEKMSAGCQAWAEMAKRMGSRVTDYCAKEIESSCSGKKGDPLGLLECLESNYVSLSYDCRVKLNEFTGSYPKPVQ